MKGRVSLLLSLLVSLTFATTVFAQARRPAPTGDETGRDAVGFRKDSVTKETVGERTAPANTPTTTQAIEDFMQLQKVNRKIQVMTKSEPVALGELAVAAKDVNTRASRLKRSLALPEVKEDKKGAVALAPSNYELLNLVKELDENIHLFVTNPRFRNIQPATQSAEAEAKEASKNLQKVIEVSHALQQSAERLKKSEK